MESIVLHSDISRLILGYLINNNLKRVALTLCRTSPHLEQELLALKQGLQPHNFLNNGLEDIIREHVKITSIVANLVQKLPLEARQRLQQRKLSECVSELIKLDRSTSINAKDSVSNRISGNRMQRKRHRVRRNTIISDDEQPNSTTPSPSASLCINSKRPRLLAPHLYCSIKRSFLDQLDNDLESVESITSSDASSTRSNNGRVFHSRGPNNNSTPRADTSDKAARTMLTAQTMPEITQAILTNEEFQSKLLSNINVALQSLAVHAPTAESVNSEAVLDSLVKNILEATESEPSFDRIIKEVVGIEESLETPTPTPVTSISATAATEKPVPPLTPLIIRSAVAAANATAACGNIEGSMANVNNSNTVIQLNNNHSLSDPNFSISKLIVFNTNESAQKQHPSIGNLSFNSENLNNFVDGTATLTDVDSVGSAIAAAGNQVFVDTVNGQLTFPMFLSNDGVISQFPFLMNNEWLTQQIRPDAFANGDVSHIEIPLPEPIKITADQLPPNSIIINSAVKAASLPVEETAVVPPTKLIEDHPMKAPTDVVAVDRYNNKPADANAVPASLDSSRLVLERVTPSTSGIVNLKAFRSLSTPRKRTSHVRTLNFSPKGVAQMQNTPVSTRRPQLKQQRRVPFKTLKAKHVEEVKQVDIQPEKPIIIKNVEILPNFGSKPSNSQAKNATVSAADTKNETKSASAPTNASTAVQKTAATVVDVSGNESNGCVPPLFFLEESSNQTVIKAANASKKTKKTPTKKICPASSLPPTPKRKQKRRVAVKACKRIISQSTALKENNNTENNNKTDKQDEKANKSESSTSKDKLGDLPSSAAKLSEQSQSLDKDKDKDNDMIAWQRQLQGTHSDLEQRLREINAKRDAETPKSSVRVPRNRINRKKKAAALESSLTGKKRKKMTSARFELKKQKQLGTQQSLQQEHQLGSTEGEFNIKITTPQKPKKSPLGDTKSAKMKVKNNQKIQDQEKQKNQEQNQQGKEKHQKGDKEQQQQLQKDQQQKEQKEQLAPVKAEIKEKLQDEFTTMSTLLETPFKVAGSQAGNDIPPTPCPSLMPPLDTPYSKLLPSASFLFGSDTKSILDTPMLTAITPGVRLTPFTLGTPHGSAAKTDYSSGSSYYRPDEAEHTDTNAQCALQPKSSTNSLEQTATKLTTTSYEVYTERVPVEPTVLRRVRSFGSEAVDSAESAAAQTTTAVQCLPETPHYTLMCGLPDAVENSNSTSFDSSTTSSGGTNTSSSDGTSTTDTSASSQPHSSQGEGVSLTAKTMELLQLDNLSEISSTEDEEWLKASSIDGSLDTPPIITPSETTQLVSQNGEVRYPIRNWLTPIKDANTGAGDDADTSGEMLPPTVIPPKSAMKPAIKSAMKSAMKCAIKSTSKSRKVIDDKKSKEQCMLELAVVRERVKAKVKQQPTPKLCSKKPNTKLTSMRETANLSNPIPSSTSKTPIKVIQTAAVATNCPRTWDAPKSVNPKPAGSLKADGEIQFVPSTGELDPALLIALNLSAKKQQGKQRQGKQQQPENQQQLERLPQQPKIGRTTVVIDAQPAPSTISRRGRPKKAPNIPRAFETRRSARRIESRAAQAAKAAQAAEAAAAEAAAQASLASEASQVVQAVVESASSGKESTKPAKLTASAKVTKKPAKKRAEARLESVAHPLATLVEADPTELTPKKLPAAPQQTSSPATEPAPSQASLSRTSSPRHFDVDFSMSSSQLANTFSFEYDNSGSKSSTHSVPRQPDSYLENYRMRIMSDEVMHTIKIDSPQILYQRESTADTNAPSDSAAYANIPKKRIKHYNRNTSDEQAQTTSTMQPPIAASTPQNREAQSEERDDDDINTPVKLNTSEDQHDAGVQIEDIESILSHLHGT